MSMIENEKESTQRLLDRIRWLEQDVELLTNRTDSNTLQIGKDLANSNVLLSQARSRVDTLEGLHRKEQTLLLHLWELSEVGAWEQIAQKLQSFHDEWEFGEK